jgi:hypothetical protein
MNVILPKTVRKSRWPTPNPRPIEPKLIACICKDLQLEFFANFIYTEFPPEKDDLMISRFFIMQPNPLSCEPP